MLSDTRSTIRVFGLREGAPNGMNRPPQTSGARTCAYHSDRPAHALCVSCKTPLCRGCATPWEGIFLCADHLAARRTATERRGSFWGWCRLAFGIALAAAVAVFLGAWLSGVWAELLAGIGS